MLSYMVPDGYMYVAGELPKIKSMLAVILTMYSTYARF